MKSSEVVNQASALLHSKGRITYRALKREFDLDDAALEDLKFELIEGQELAVDKDGKMLVWTGTPREQPARGDAPEPRSILPIEAERRQLTVMFCDLVGSTALSTQLDPEELREVIRAYRETCATVIRHFDGYLAKYIGDGLLVYFGYPVAHEDDAQRAIRAGLGIVGAMQALPLQNTRLQYPLQVRIGIHTGLVVAGEMGTVDQPEPLAIVGETPNIATRLQEHARPNSVVISPSTYRLVQGLFECQDLGSQLLKGLATPLSVYQVVHESEARNRFEASMTLGLTPLIGRAYEMEFLHKRWEQAAQGAGQVVLLSGEPGIGKSRLVKEFTEQLGHEGVTRMEFRCSPYHQNSAQYPIIDYLQHLLQFAREDSPAVKLEKLQHALSRYHFPQADMLPLLASLLSLPHPEGYPPIIGSPQKQKEKTQAALVAWLIEEAKQHTVYTIWEDLHWADPSTLEVLTLVVDQAPTAPLYVLLTFRPEFTPPWENRSHVSQLTLSRLGRSEVETMVEQVTGDKALPAEVVQKIVAKTDGVPLFVEELTKSVMEAVGALCEAPLRLEIPATLQDSLMARLDRLGPAKEIAQLGATIGREFNYELLQAVAPLDEVTLRHRLKQLMEAELVYQRGPLPQAYYLFKHALVQDTAYQSLLKSTRQQYHQKIAQALADHFPEAGETQPELLAHHYTEAGLAKQAIPYWQQAGERASQRSAYVEAVAHFTRGLELLKALSDTPGRVQQELTLQIALGVPLMATKGYAAPEVEKTFTRARELCQHLGETPQLVPVLWSLVLFYFNRGEAQTAHELAEQMMHLAQRARDQFLLSLAHKALGWPLFLRGEFSLARLHVEQAVTLYDPQQHPRSAVNTADPRLDCLIIAAWTLWYLGYPDQALKRIQKTMALAVGLARPFNLVMALGCTVLFYLLRREEPLARERAETTISLSSEHGFAQWLAVGTILRGWALAEQGQMEKGITHMQQGMAAYRAMGVEMFRPYYLALLAEADGKVGRVKEGLPLLTEALATVQRTGERFYEAELYRLKGELTLQQAGKEQRARSEDQKLEILNPQSQILDPESEAEACFLKAIDIARRQQAKSLELRAATSLARLWQQQGKQKEAHRLLSEIYNWFTEGFDTKDLQEAQALLEEVSQ